MWIFVEGGTGRILAGGDGEPVAANHDLSVGYLVNIPEQDLRLYEEGVHGLPTLRERYYPRDVVTFTAEEAAARIDRETDAAIEAQIHATAPIGEQIGILRDQIVRILNSLGLDATEGFALLNEIATTEIKKGRTKKEALDA